MASKANFRASLGLKACLKQMNMKPHLTFCGLLWFENAWKGSTIDPHTSDRVQLIPPFMRVLATDFPAYCLLPMTNSPWQACQNDPRWMPNSHSQPVVPN